MTRKINIDDVVMALQSINDITPDVFDNDALTAIMGCATGIVEVIKDATDKQEEAIKLGVILGTMLSIGYQIGNFEGSTDTTVSKMAC